MKTIFNLFCIVAAFLLGFHAQGVRQPSETQMIRVNRSEGKTGPADSVACPGHCDSIERLTETDREHVLAKVRERVASYETEVNE
ncbi:hypothetical protein V7x_55080 [Crateriforma conspicua]|uniref:Secreted protein n=1 Tax=Crateriforma conspicua TaxID=2527996 RepID=A0A5C6FCZ5_9PLAN|nr:hypothetical protein V7x_55080 [Crateriforma conspicua]